MSLLDGINLLSKYLSRRGLLPFLSEQLNLIEAGAVVLNVGSGGDIGKQISSAQIARGFAVTSTDIDPSRNPDVVDDISSSSFQDESFDAIIIMEVLEHVPNPFQAASELCRLLKPGGRLILSVPYIFPLHDRPYDFFRFTKYGLANLFLALEDVQIRERNSWAEAILVLIARLANGQGRKGKIMALILSPVLIFLMPLAFLASRFVPSDFITTGYVMKGMKQK